MNTRKIKVAMGQMLVEAGKPQANMQRALEMIQEAGSQKCQFIVLPECLDAGWTSPTARTLAEPVPEGSRTQQLAEAACQADIYVVAGLTEHEGDRIYNTAVLIAPDRSVLLKHRKINVLTIAQDIYSIGNNLGVAETEFGTVGISICADNLSSSLVFAHAMARMGARLILSPSAWAVDADHDDNRRRYGKEWEEPYSAIADFYGAGIIGVSNVGWITDGPWQGRKCIGCSLAVGSNGQILARGAYGADAQELNIVEVTLTPQEVKGTDYASFLADKGYVGP